MVEIPTKVKMLSCIYGFADDWLYQGVTNIDNVLEHLYTAS